MDMKSRLKGAMGSTRANELTKRVEELEKSVAELRTQNLRLAEVTDVVQELLIPLASRDQARIDAAISRFSDGL